MRRMRRPFLLALLWLVEVPLAALVALLIFLWFWSGSDQSLATALRQAGSYLPAGHTLVAEDVRGTLRHGGEIGMLRWENDGMQVQAKQIVLSWQPISLLNRKLQLDKLDVAELTIADRSPPSATAASPLEQLLLPFNVDLHFSIRRLSWEGPPAVEARELTGHYTFDQRQHALALDRALYADGSYSANATLLARSPMTLGLELQGKVRAPLGERSIALDVSGSARGPLAGLAPVLDIEAQLRPEEAAAPPASGPRRQQPQAASTAMRASLAAKVSPRSAQPVLSAQATFSQLDLSVLLDGAPQTSLTGDARVVPAGSGWRAQAALRNGLPGPWDKQRLPIDNARAVVDYLDGRWTIQSLDAAGAGGTVKAEGRLAEVSTVNALGGWQGQAQLRGINPAAIHSELAPARLDGRLSATAAQQAIVFDAEIRAAGPQPARSVLPALRLQNAAATGRWDGGWLNLKSFRLRTDDAQLQGQVDLQLATRFARGRLELTMPGGNAVASGQLGAQDGAGELNLRVSNATLASRWLIQLPEVPELFAGTVAGSGELALQWQGGWQPLVSGQGTQPVLQVNLRLPEFALRAPDQSAEQSLRLRDLVIAGSGRLDAMSVTANGTARQGTRSAVVQTRVDGGSTSTGNWKATVQNLRVQAQDQSQPGPWTINLRQPVTVDWQPAASGGTLTATAGVAELTGPLPGSATLAWEPLRWSQGARNEFVSKGQLRGLGLAWLDLLGNNQLTNLGLAGDMVFDGAWDIAATDRLRLQASLVRRGGDIRIQTDTASGAAPSAPSGRIVDAGVRDARLTVDADGPALRATLLWDSERAGNAQVSLDTRVTRDADGWAWAADAPLRGNVRARLPQVGAWSLLAPPGWRIRGTLDANIALAGTRAAPLWSGTLQADDLGVRSVVDGIEFGNGSLRATLQGQRMDIRQFSLQGAGGAAGGELRATGFVAWLPDGTGANPALAKVRMELNATASALRVSARADRRLAVSGDVQARLDSAKLEIRGALKADQALFVLPDETAPRLGSDVVVRRSSQDTGPGLARTTGSAAAAPAAAVTLPGTRVITDLQVSLDLGPDFRVQGRGITTRLAGTLQLRSTAGANAAPRLTGEVRTVQGSYKAYGQQLDIEQGVMRFLGPYDNPSLDILAIRPNLTQRVGVQITGTVLSPRIRLYSEPELPEAEKLAWLVLGRSGADGGAEAAVLQQAALALLGRNGSGGSGGIASRLGLDELSFSAASANNGNGTAVGATVLLGKRISRNFYVAYERSLAGALGTFSIFYDLSRRFTLRARTGEQTAVDLIFTYRYD